MSVGKTPIRISLEFMDLVSGAVRHIENGAHVIYTKTRDAQPFIVGHVVAQTCSTGGYYYHRLDGPAKVYLLSAVIVFCVKDVGYVCTKDYCRAAGMSDEETFMWVLRFGDRLPNTCEAYYGEAWKDMSVEEF